MNNEDTDRGRFSPFPYISKTPQGKQEMGSYLVYASAAECKHVKAVSAAEAMRVSGIAQPIKIVRFNPMNQVMLPQGMFE